MQAPLSLVWRDSVHAVLGRRKTCQGIWVPRALDGSIENEWGGGDSAGMAPDSQADLLRKRHSSSNKHLGQNFSMAPPLVYSDLGLTNFLVLHIHT